MISFRVPITLLLAIYYMNLSSVVRSLIVLEFMSFYLLFLTVYLGASALLGIYFTLLLFLTFVIEGVIGILLLVFYINYSVSSMVMLVL